MTVPCKHEVPASLCSDLRARGLLVVPVYSLRPFASRRLYP